MLVLARRLGEQIVLPGIGVTIDVVGVTKSQVRLGIEAPTDVPIYRREILDRVLCQGETRSGGKAEPTKRPTALTEVAETKNKDTAAASRPDLACCLARWVAHRTSGRIHRLSVKTVGGQTVICGRATSHYARQLAQSAVGEVLEHWSSRPLPHVEYEIEIVDRSFQRRTGADLSLSARAANCHTE